ncbi:MAG: nuclear transport factor 2 family protein, partial [Pseudomonadota bacterium]|nr:nuclear transport factor 2 family protein [Pseudomonadota bacterium]
FGHFEAVAHRRQDSWRLRRRASYLKIPYIEPEYQLVGLPDLEKESKHRAKSSCPEATQKDYSASGQDLLHELSDRLDELEQRSRTIDDRAEIYRLFIELQDATDNRDGKRYGQCFTEDGEWSGVTGKAVGQAEITQYMSNFLTPWESEESRTFHSISDLAIDLQGDLATARAQYRHYKLGNDGRPLAFHFCHYEAILQRTRAGWRFKRRDSYMDIPYRAPQFQLPDAGT